MSILFSKIDKMMGLMNAESQFEIATLISDKYLHGPSKCVVPKSKSKPRKKSEVFHGFYEVSSVNRKEKGFKRLVGAWCKEEDVGRSTDSVYVVMVKNDQPYGAYDKSRHDGEKYAIVETKTSTVVQCLHGLLLSSDTGAKTIYKWNEFGALVFDVDHMLQEL